MKLSFSHSLAERVAASGVVAVVVLDCATEAAPLAEALEAGGIDAVELALRTEGSLAALAQFRHCAPHFLLGAGTVIAAEQVQAVKEVGVDFAVSPGTSASVLAAAAAAGLPFAPGVAVPSDIEIALAYGCNFLKFFPAEPLGGVRFLRTMAAPYRHLQLRYIPLGGLNKANIVAYLQEPLVAAVGGSWVAPRELIAAGNWEEITLRASRAVSAVRQARQLSSEQ